MLLKFRFGFDDNNLVILVSKVDDNTVSIAMNSDAGSSSLDFTFANTKMNSKTSFTLLNDKENEKVISQMTENWEVDRIAMMDVLLMKMAITEATTFSNIPVKVTLNEYIELSKNYSSPKSKVFINGILDKIFELYKTEGKIKKAGRGLIE